jgi:hypothetical protein
MTYILESAKRTELYVMQNIPNLVKGRNKFSIRIIRWRNCGGHVRIELAGPFQPGSPSNRRSICAAKWRAYSNLAAVLHLHNIHVLSG